jgi:predicted type IV restriction endonuclease
VALTPEEWVRQHVLHYLIFSKSFPIGHIGVETPLAYNQMKKRADIVVFKDGLVPVVLVECKSPEININEKTLAQAARYHKSLQAKWLILSNGYLHVVLERKVNGRFEIRKELPDYGKL